MKEITTGKAKKAKSAATKKVTAKKAKSATKKVAAKKAKSAATKKVTAKKAANGNGSVAPRLTDDIKIKQVSNPFREGTRRWNQLEWTKKGTVAAFHKAGGNNGFLTWFIRKGFVVRT